KHHGNRFWEHHSAHYMRLSPEEKQQGYLKLMQKLKKPNRDFIYRGTLGNMELREALETGRLGRNFSQSGKSFSFNLTAYIRDNDSAFLLSASESPMTAKPYAACISKMPCRGFIIVLGLPKVYTIPHNLLQINKKLFTDYDQHMLQDSHCIENGGTKYNSIIDITKSNNETTIILTDSDAKKNWRPILNYDIHQVIEVCGPGRLFGSMMSFTQPILISEIPNPTFKKRQLSVETVLNCNENMSESIKNAQTNGLILSDNRFLTLEDANALDNTGILDSYIEDSKEHETIRLSQVPRDIPIGHQNKLFDYATQQLQQSVKTNNILRIK
ncbi:MAG: hypothetical protein ACO1N3_03700, partial [Gammaproteobacteria bacterium]